MLPPERKSPEMPVRKPGNYRLGARKITGKARECPEMPVCFGKRVWKAGGAPGFDPQRTGPL